jgi:hypothetical protein
MSDNTKQTVSNEMNVGEAQELLLDAKLAMVIAYAKEVREGGDEEMLDQAISLLSGPGTLDQERFSEEEEAKAA